MKLLSCNSNIFLSQKISKFLNTSLVDADIRRFSDNEIFVEVKENVRGEDVFVIQSTSYPANDNIMELLITIDALKRASAKRVTAVIPYFGYARQDRKVTPRTPISAKLFANIVSKAGTDRILTLDLHAAQIQGFFDIPVDNLFIAPIFIDDIKNNFNSNETIIVSPDIGGLARARSIANKINSQLAIVDKRRPKPGSSEVMNIIGNVKNKNCIIVDDIIDSGGTLCNAVDALLDNGANSVSAYVVHGVLSGDAISKINNSNLQRLVISDSIANQDKMFKINKMRVISSSNLIGKAILNIFEEKSVSTLFD